MSNPRTKNRAFLVLGMHRGGTSASTRALQTLGVELGQDLLGPNRENPRGFFEDEPLLQISDRILDLLGMRWDSPRLISKRFWRDPDLAALGVEATESIRRRFSAFPDWGFKNPRSARLLPFWNAVLERTERRPSYLIVLRNPLSVAQSLHMRNGLSHRRAHLLWLLHMTEAVLYSQGHPRVCLNFDSLLAGTFDQLTRVARELGLRTLSKSSPEYCELVESFLTTDLQSTHFEPSDLEGESDLSALAMSLFGILERWSRDDPTLSETRIQRVVRETYRSLRAIEPVLEDLAETDRERAEFEAELIERRAELRSTAEEIDRLTDLSTDREAALLAQIETSTHLSSRLEGLGQELLIERNQRADAELANHQAIQAYEQRLAQARIQAEKHQERIQALCESQARLELTIGNQSTRIEALLEMGDDLRRVEAELRDRLAESNNRHEHLRQRIDESEHEIRAAHRRIRDLEHRTSSREREIEILNAQSEALAQARVEWLRIQIRQLTGRLIEHVAAMAETRQWQLARTLQLGLSRLRRRSWIDGMAQLKTLAIALHAETGRQPLDIAFLASLSGDVSRTFRELSSAETFAASRHLSRIRAAVLLRKRDDGPFEHVRNRVGELHFHLSQLTSAPTAIQIPQSPSVDRITVGSTVDIVIPVYQAREATLRCIQSVLDSRNQTPIEVVVIDDASKDPHLLRALESLARDGRITLLRNDQNLGFPGTANRGMSLHPDRHVVMLNSDTLVHGDWVDRLRRCAHSDPRIATVTPFSNNAEICSYPALCRAEPIPSEKELAELDTLAARANHSLKSTLPTAIGFCMYIRREAIQRVGLFDTDRFRRGYGEENDFSLRAREQGFVHVLAPDVFVAHEGGASFSDNKQALVEAGLAELDRLHPGYRGEIHRFIQQDSILRFRRRLDLARILPEDRPSLLMISHSHGGGTDRHVVELARHLEAGGTPVLILRPVSSDVTRLTRLEAASMTNLDFRLPEDFAHLVEILRDARVGHVHLQHTLGLDAIIRELPAALGCAFDATLHDYLTVCPRVHLVDETGRFCGLPEPAVCTRCVANNGSPVGSRVDVDQWRRDHLAWLEGARKVFVPSEDTRGRLAPLMPEVRLTVRPHPETCDPSSHLRPPRTGRTRKVAVIGAIGIHKGADVLEACARDAATRKLPIEFHLIGYSDRDEILSKTGKVTITGAYEEAQLPSLLRRARCHVAFIPSVWPETFCYTLSAVFQSRIYPVAFDLGAVADRIADAGWGDLIPLDSPPAKINDHLLALEYQIRPPSNRANGITAHYPDYLEDYYDGLKF